MSSLELLDSAQHKLRLAHYHAETLLGILAQHPHDGPDEPLRAPLEAHLEGLAYTGTAATEKTIRSVDPNGIPSMAPIQRMIIEAKAERQTPATRAFAGEFENWWVGRQRGTRFAQVARDLRNDAAHRVYEMAPDGPRWRMELSQGRPIAIDDFANGYLLELEELETLVGSAEELAAVAAG